MLSLSSYLFDLLRVVHIHLSHFELILDVFNCFGRVDGRLLTILKEITKQSRSILRKSLKHVSHLHQCLWSHVRLHHFFLKSLELPFGVTVVDLLDTAPNLAYLFWVGLFWGARVTRLECEFGFETCRRINVLAILVEIRRCAKNRLEDVLERRIMLQAILWL